MKPCTYFTDFSNAGKLRGFCGVLGRKPLTDSLTLQGQVSPTEGSDYAQRCTPTSEHTIQGPGVPPHTGLHEEAALHSLGIPLRAAGRLRDLTVLCLKMSPANFGMKCSSNRMTFKLQV